MDAEWPVIYPKRKLHPDFVAAVRQSMANAHQAKWQRKRGETPTVYGISGSALTTLGNFGHPCELSRVLHPKKPIPASPRIITRLEALARAVGYDGEMFDEETETAALVAAEQGARL